MKKFILVSKEIEAGSKDKAKQILRVYLYELLDEFETKPLDNKKPRIEKELQVKEVFR